MSTEDRKLGEVQEIEIVVDRGQTPLRIDKFLFDRLEKTSRNRIQDGVADGVITVNGGPSNQTIR